GIRDYKVTGVQTCALPIYPLADLLAMTEPETVDTQIEILRSQPFLEAAFRAAGCPLAGVVGGKHTPEVRVDHVKDTNVIEVTVRSEERRVGKECKSRRERE